MTTTKMRSKRTRNWLFTFVSAFCLSAHHMPFSHSTHVSSSSATYDNLDTNEHRAAEEQRVTTCFSSLGITWISDGRRIFVRDPEGTAHAVHIRGGSWPGLDATTMALEGLNMNNMEEILDVLQQHGFNAIRVPLSADFAFAAATDLAGFTDLCEGVEAAKAQLHRLFKRAGAHGMMIMLDMHRLHSDGRHGRTERFEIEDMVSAWDVILTEYSIHPNLFAIDAFDGPHFSTQWSARKIDYAALITRLSEFILMEHSDFQGLLGIKPVHEEENHVADHLAGGDEWLDRVVYTPHFLGTFSLSNNPKELPEFLNHAYGYLDMNDHGVLVAEWHSTLVDSGIRLEATRMNIQAEWMRTKGITNVFWDLSSSRNGIFEADWSTPVECRVQILKRLLPEPTVFAHAHMGTVCVTDWGKSECGGGGGGGGDSKAFGYQTAERCNANYNGLHCSTKDNGYNCVTCADYTPHTSSIQLQSRELLLAENSGSENSNSDSSSGGGDSGGGGGGGTIINPKCVTKAIYDAKNQRDEEVQNERLKLQWINRYASRHDWKLSHDEGTKMTWLKQQMEQQDVQYRLATQPPPPPSPSPPPPPPPPLEGVDLTRPGDKTAFAVGGGGGGGGGGGRVGGGAGGGGGGGRPIDLAQAPLPPPPRPLSQDELKHIRLPSYDPPLQHHQEQQHHHQQQRQQKQEKKEDEEIVVDASYIENEGDYFIELPDPDQIIHDFDGALGILASEQWKEPVKRTNNSPQRVVVRDVDKRLKGGLIMSEKSRSGNGKHVGIDAWRWRDDGSGASGYSANEEGDSGDWESRDYFTSKGNGDGGGGGGGEEVHRKKGTAPNDGDNDDVFKEKEERERDVDGVQNKRNGKIGPRQRRRTLAKMMGKGIGDEYELRLDENGAADGGGEAAVVDAANWLGAG